MLLDLTLPVTQEMLGTAWDNTDKSLVGHLGTHFDVMDQAFPLHYTERKAVAFDVSSVRDREILPEDVDLTLVEADMFVAFYTGFAKEVPYGTPLYFKEHPQLSHALIDALLAKNISIIGVDCGGIRRGKEHVPADQRCANQGVFVIENLYNVKEVLALGGRFTARTFPIRVLGITGLPCRVIAQID